MTQDQQRSKTEDENDDEDDWGRKEAGKRQGRQRAKFFDHARRVRYLTCPLTCPYSRYFQLCYNVRVETLFDYEKVDVYRVELAFIAWIADFLGGVVQSSSAFPNRPPRLCKRGGARPGAGRPKGPGLVQVKVWVSPETKDALGEAATALGTTKSQYVERAIRMLAVKEKVP